MHEPHTHLAGRAGHAYYFLEDVYPRMSGGRRPLRTPGIIRALLPERRVVEQPAGGEAPGPEPEFEPAPME